MYKKFPVLCVVACLLLLQPGHAQSAATPIQLAAAFNGVPVIQRGLPTAIWGTASGYRNRPLRVGVLDRDGVEIAAGVTTVGSDAQWRVSVTLPNSAKGQHTLSFTANSKGVLTKSILVGEVWLCSGQSNMAWAVTQSDISLTSDPQLRVLRVPPTSSPDLQEDLPENVRWEYEASTIASASAVCIAMGSKLRLALGVPIGLISAAKGSTLIEEWIDARRLRNFPVTNAGEAVVYGQWFNAMIYPLRGYSTRGIAWYQGEHNSSSEPVGSRTVNATRYLSLLPALFTNWRSLWKESGGSDVAAALIYQLGASGCDNPRNNRFPELREAQRLASNVIPNSRLVPAFDTAEFRLSTECASGYIADVHSRYKKIVGERGAALALGAFYSKQNQPKESPVLESSAFLGRTAHLSFRDNGALKLDPDFASRSIEVCCDANRNYTRAASISVGEEGLLKVTAPESVSAVEAVRYAYHSVVISPFTEIPQGAESSFLRKYILAGLTDRFGIPIAPFSTEHVWQSRGSSKVDPSVELYPILHYNLNLRRLRGWACYAHSPFSSTIAVVSRDRSAVYFEAPADLPSNSERTQVCDTQGGESNHDFDVILPPEAVRALLQEEAEVIVKPFVGYR